MGLYQSVLLYQLIHFAGNVYCHVNFVHRDDSKDNFIPRICLTITLVAEFSWSRYVLSGDVDGGGSKNRTVLCRGYFCACRNIGRPRNR